MKDHLGRAVSFLEKASTHLLFHLLPFPLQVRKSSQEVLLALLEQALISQGDVEGKLCPVLLERSAPACDDECRAEAMSVSPLGVACALVATVGLAFHKSWILASTIP